MANNKSGQLNLLEISAVDAPRLKSPITLADAKSFLNRATKRQGGIIQRLDAIEAKHNPDFLPGAQMLDRNLGAVMSEIEGMLQDEESEPAL